MKRPDLQPDWPDSWKTSYHYDQEEVFGPIRNLGYAYTYKNRQQAAIDLIEEVVPQCGVVLDVAAAQGNFSLLLAERGYRVTWNDLRSELADYVRLKHEHGEISYAPGNIFELEFPEPFDCVLITEIIEHVAHPDQFLKRIAELLKPGGYVVMTTPNGRYFKNDLPRFSECSNPEVFEAVQFQPNSDGHIFLLWPDEIRSLCAAAGLRIDRFRQYNNPLTAGHVKLHKLLPFIPRFAVNWIEAASRLVPPPISQHFLTQSAARFYKPQRTIT